MLDKNFEKKIDGLISNSDLDPEVIKAIYKTRYNLERMESTCNDLNTLSAAGWEGYEDFDGKNKNKMNVSKLIEVDLF